LKVMIDLDHRSQRVVPVLGLATANRQRVIEAQPHFLLPERKQRVEIIGGKTDIDLWFRQFHFVVSGVHCATSRHLDAERG
jgi:hypothetical protein